MLEVLPGRYAVCRLDPGEAIPHLSLEHRFWSITHTRDELSLVLPQESVPAGRRFEGGWCCLRVLGLLDFGLTGVLASLATPLARAGISIFAISTYDTDYLLVREGDLASAKRALAESGHIIQSEAPDDL
ncbi:MAG: ACT domain-containing protein [Anaerolineae bacterium]|nr:ACT domain-containing protein [Anaerolineae bacterium]